MFNDCLKPSTKGFNSNKHQKTKITKKNKQKEKKIYTILSFFVIIKLYHFRESRYHEKNIYFNRYWIRYN